MKKKIVTLFNIKIGFCLTIFMSAAGLTSAQKITQDEVNAYLKNLPFKMEEIKLPSFSNKIFNVLDNGAVPDGQTLNTEAINKTIKTCSEAGGGTVLIPSGLWLTGPIEMHNNVNLHLNKGALVVFSPNHNLYPIVDPPKRGMNPESPINGYNLKNIAITGEGIFDGSGNSWRPVKKEKMTEKQWNELIKSGGVVNSEGTVWWPSEEAMNGEAFIKKLKKSKKEITAEDLEPAVDYLRPYMVLLIECENVLIDGVTIKNSPKFALYPNWCNNVVVNNVKVNNEWWAQNGDGIDISSCKNVLVSNCTVTAGDDGICMKSSDDKEIKNPTLENVVIQDCIVYHGHGGFVIGSNVDGGMKNIYVNNCSFIGTDIGLRFKSARDRGALVEDVYINNIRMKDIKDEAILFNTYYENESGEKMEHEVTATTPHFERFYIDSVFCLNAAQAVAVAGLPEMPINHITIKNSFISAKKGFYSKYADDFVVDNVKINSEKDPVFNVNQSSNFELNKISFLNETKIFMKLSGEKTGSIKIRNTDLTGLANPLIFSEEIKKDAVNIY